MVRTGIYKINQLSKASLKDVFGKEKNISINLYKLIYQSDNNKIKDKYADIILNRFNSDRNVIKRTSKNRFDFFDDTVISQIKYMRFDRIDILDLAISDGRASCYFLSQAIKNLDAFRYTGSDISIKYFMYKKKADSKAFIILDSSNEIIEITRPPFVWNLARKEGQFYFLNNFLKKRFFRKSQKDIQNKKYIPYCEIELLSPEYKSLLNENDKFTVADYNLFSTTSRRYNVMRAMNILHYGYFNKDQLLKIADNLYNGLEIGGILVEGSNEDSGTPVEGAVYTKSETGFKIICQPENPSRIEDILLSYKPT